MKKVIDESDKIEIGSCLEDKLNLDIQNGFVGNITKFAVITDSIVKILKKANLPTTIPSYIDRENLVKKLYLDKKVKNGQLRFVIQKGIGNVVEFYEGVYAPKIEENITREFISSM